jgi:hypothetical protein
VITVHAEYKSMLPEYFTREAARKFAYKLTFKPITICLRMAYGFGSVF